MEAWPLLSVVTLGAETCAPVDASKVTNAPLTGLPEASASETTSGVASNAPGRPLWLSPCTLVSWTSVLESALMARVPSADDADDCVSTAWIATVWLAAVSGTTMLQLNDPLAVVTVKFGWPVSDI